MNKNNKKIYIYWNDIKKYYDSCDQKKPTKMYTEGVLLGERGNFILVKDPETLNLDELKNHPQNKPSFYAIPKGMIEEIKEIK